MTSSITIKYVVTYIYDIEDTIRYTRHIPIIYKTTKKTHVALKHVCSFCVHGEKVKIQKHMESEMRKRKNGDARQV